MVDQQGSTVNPYRFAGQYFDAFSDLYSMRARVYDPGIGRFLSVDPAGLDTRNPVELNRYTYAANDPIGGYDPSGRGLVEYGKTMVQVIGRNSPLMGAAGGFVYGAISYLAASTGACGAARQQETQQLEWWQYVTITTTIGAAGGALFGALANSRGYGAVIGAVLLLGLSLTQMHQAYWNFVKAPNVCDGVDFLLSFVGALTATGEFIKAIDAMRLARMGPWLPYMSPPKGGTNPPGDDTPPIGTNPGDDGSPNPNPGDDGLPNPNPNPGDDGSPDPDPVDPEEPKPEDPCANSFSADTMVATPEGKIAIANIEVGDQVLAYNTTTGTTQSYTVTNVLIHNDPVIVHLTLDTLQFEGKLEQIETTIYRSLPPQASPSPWKKGIWFGVS